MTAEFSTKQFEKDGFSILKDVFPVERIQAIRKDWESLPNDAESIIPKDQAGSGILASCAGFAETYTWH